MWRKANFALLVREMNNLKDECFINHVCGYLALESVSIHAFHMPKPHIFKYAIVGDLSSLPYFLKVLKPFE